MNLRFGRSVLDLLGVGHHDTASAADADPAPGAAGEDYVLVYNPPEQPLPGHGQGWTLTTSPPGPRPRPVSLAARGAGAHAGLRVAKAVAVRVLADRGVRVAGWCDPVSGDDLDGLTVFRARLGSNTDLATPSDSAGAHPPTTPSREKRSTR